MLRARKRWFALVVPVALALAALACDPTAGAGGGSLTVAILSPAAGSNVEANEPVEVQVSAADPDGPGVYRVDLLANDVTVDSYEGTVPEATLTVALTFTPVDEGMVALSVVAFREDGTASAPATLALTVGAGSVASGPTPSPGPATSSEVRVQAQANLDVNIRAECGPGCPIIGVWPNDATGDFLIRTTSPTEWWYWTDFLGEDQLGCVYQGQEQRNFTLMESDDPLPREPEHGCLYCGDGILSPELGEACDGAATGACGGGCEADCSCTPYCGDGIVQAEIGETCESDDACDEGYACEGCACVQVGYCGDGIVQTGLGEACESDDACGEGFECQDCACVELPPEPVCGDGIVQPEAGEQCEVDADCSGCPYGDYCAGCQCECLQY